MKITHANGFQQSLTDIDCLEAVKEEAEYQDDPHAVTARLLETLYAKGTLTKEELGKILNLDIVEIAP